MPHRARLVVAETACPRLRRSKWEWGISKQSPSRTKELCFKSHRQILVRRFLRGDSSFRSGATLSAAQERVGERLENAVASRSTLSPQILVATCTNRNTGRDRRHWPQMPSARNRLVAADAHSLITVLHISKREILVQCVRLARSK